jgi:type I restriction enzyme S subunit
MTGKNHTIKTARIKDVAELDPETLGESTAPGFTFKYIDLSSVKGGRVGEHVESMTFAAAPGRARKLVKEGDILLGMVRPYLKPFAKVQRVFDCHVASTGFAVIRAKSDVTDPEYLYQTIWSDGVSKQIHQMVTGSNYPALSVGDVKDLKVPLPPLAEQRKIAEILRTWDEAIETAEAELKAKQSLLKRAVDKYFERTHRNAASGTVGELKTLDAVCTRKGEYGAAVSACPFNPEWPRYIRITDITDTGILKKERAVSISPESAEGYRLEIGDLLFARTGEPGRCLIFNEAYPAAFAGYLIRFKARPEVILSDYVYYYTLSSVYGKWVGDVSQKGAQANINAKVYGSLQLPVTDLASQEAAVRVFKALQEDVFLAERGVELLSAQKRGLMQKLLTGEVRVAT